MNQQCSWMHAVTTRNRHCLSPFLSDVARRYPGHDSRAGELMASDMATHCARHRRRCRHRWSGVVNLRSPHRLNRQNQHARRGQSMNGRRNAPSMRKCSPRPQDAASAACPCSTASASFLAPCTRRRTIPRPARFPGESVQLLSRLLPCASLADDRHSAHKISAGIATTHLHSLTRLRAGGSGLLARRSKPTDQGRL